MQVETLKRVTIQGRSDGLDKVASDLNKVEGAYERVATVTDSSAKRQLSAERSWAALQVRVDDSARAQQAFAKAQAIADRALQQGVATVNEHARVMEMARKRYLDASVANDNLTKSTAALGFQAKQTLVQLPDVIQGIAGGQGVFRTAVQQGGQLVQIWGMAPGGVGGALRQIGAEFATLLTPVRLLGVGVAAVGAAAVASVISWKNYALAIDDVARIAGASTRDISALQAVASFKGIGQNDFAAGMKQFASSVYDARNGATELYKLLRSNGQAVGDTATTFERVADLVAKTRDDQQRLQILQQAGLPSTMEWVRLMSGGAEGIRQAKNAAVEFGGAANDEMIRKAREFDDAWNKAWTNFKRQFYSSVYEGASFLDQLSAKATGLLSKVSGLSLSSIGANLLKAGHGSQLTQSEADDFYRAVSPGIGVQSNTGKTVDPREVERQNQLEQQRIQLLGDLATVEERVRLKEIEIAQARLSGVPITEQQKDKIIELAREQAELNDKMERLSALGDAATVWERYSAKIDELNIKLKQGKINQDDFVRASRAANPVFQTLRDSAVSFTQALASGLMRGQTLMQSLRGAAQQLGTALVSGGINQIAKDNGNVVMGGLMIGGGLIANALGQDSEKQQRAAQAAAQAQQSLANAQKQLAEAAKQADAAIRDLSRGIRNVNLADQIAQLQAPLQELQDAAIRTQSRYLLSVFQQEAGNVEQQTTALINAYIHSFYVNTGELDDVQRRLLQLDQDAQQLKDVGVALGVVNDAMAAAKQPIIVDFLGSLQQKLNDLSGSGYLNSVNEALDAAANLRRDAADLGVEANSTIDRILVASMQKIIDESELTGDAFNAVRNSIGDLGSQLHEFSDTAAEAAATLARNNAAKSILEYVNDLYAGPSSTLSPTARLNAAQSAYNSQLSLAQGGNIDAYNSITKYAEDLRTALSAVYGSSAAYQAGLSTLTSQLTALPAVQQATDPVVAALRDVITAVQATTAAVGGTTSAVGNVNGTLGTINTSVGGTTAAIGGVTTAVGGTTAAVGGVNTSIGTVNTSIGGTTAAVGGVTSAVGGTTAAVGGTTSAVGGTTAAVDALRSIQNDSAAQLQLLNRQLTAGAVSITYTPSTGGSLGGSAVSFTLTNNMITALNKIVYNTGQTVNAVRQQFTWVSGAGWIGYDTGLTGTFARGGWITGGTPGVDSVRLASGDLGMPGEFVVRRDVAQANASWLDGFNRTGRLPSNDNSIVAELRALRAEVSELRRENSRLARITAAGAEYVGERVDRVHDATRDGVREAKFKAA